MVPHRDAPRIGDRLYLVPNTRGAPGAAYRLPQVTVIALHGHRGLVWEATVRLPRRPGQHLADEVRTSLRNLARTRPAPPEQPAPRTGRRPAINPDSGAREVPLW